MIQELTEAIERREVTSLEIAAWTQRERDEGLNREDAPVRRPSREAGERTSNAAGNTWGGLGEGMDLLDTGYAARIGPVSASPGTPPKP